MRIPCAIAVFGFCLHTVGFASDFSSRRWIEDWKLQPADPSRPGLLESRTLSAHKTKVLARMDSTPDGQLTSVHWSAEKGVHSIDLPDAVFWRLLDASGSWAEIDPETLPPLLRLPTSNPIAQAFLCRTCTPTLVATTQVSHGTTGLHFYAAHQYVPTRTLEVAQGVTESSILSVATQHGLTVQSLNPCRNKGGTCTIRLLGDDGESWTFFRKEPDSSWRNVRASMPGGNWWSREWNWDSLRTTSPREFHDLLESWLDSHADVLARRLLGPIEPLLTLNVDAWNRRELDGLDLEVVATELAQVSEPPEGLVLTRSPHFEASIDARGARHLVLGTTP